ncbi:hypothetical protein ABZ951_11805 [Streptomyces sp. NPDC046215]|uniref:Neocarzinostatin family protein n=1 Tax=Streptomyces stramineus TaxID=173861 RepID=A0ABN1AGV9_9ACTN
MKGAQSPLGARIALLALLLAPVLLLLPGRPAAAVTPAVTPAVTLDRTEAGKGGSITVSGSGWPERSLLTLLICGQNMIGGTNACANADGRTVTTGPDGAFRRKIPVAEPPKPCPCVVHVATVSGGAKAADAPFRVAGHPVAPLPPQAGGERLGVLAVRLEGDSGLLTWFGAPPSRRLVVTVGNLGTAPAKDPVFRVGTAHGVLAPSWEERRWRGTIAAGERARVPLDVELPAGAHGDYLISLKYGGKVLAEEPWDVPRPWGMTLFWILLCAVVPAALFRAGMAIVDRLRPPAARKPVRTPRNLSGSRGPARRRRPPTRPWSRRTAPAEPEAAARKGALPWFAPGAGPGPAGRGGSDDGPG